MAYYTAVRYGYDKYVGGFLATLDGLRRNQKVVIHTDRGVELGELLRTFDGDIPEALKVPLVGEVLRKATEEDIERAEQIQEVDQVREFKYAHEAIDRLKVKMKLSRVEHLLGGDKVIFFFMAEGRVDFRELVRDLARQFRTRIEMRQIGVRDEAKLKGLCEMCGEELCCRKHLRQLEPVSMSMAKNQLKSLDPTRLSGRCGRLRCCLSYEDPVYTELKKDLPKIGSKVQMGKHTNTVVEQLPLKGEVVVVNDHKVRAVLTAAEVRKLRAEQNLPTGPDTQVRHSGDTKVVEHLSDETEVRKRQDNRRRRNRGRRPDDKK